MALPQGENVVYGNATFDRSISDQLTVNQSTDKLITNFDSFSIAQPESVHFIQNSVSSVALNRVVGGDPSAIMGTLTATGKIFVINPNGVVFGHNSHVDVGGLVASTLDISNEDFLAENYNFAGQGAAVVNYGDINAPGGYVALLGSHVANHGAVVAEMGSVVLASGEAVTMTLDPQGLINVVVDQPTSQDPTRHYAAVENSGVIQANGGRVVLTAQTLNDVFDFAVNNTGIIEAKNFEELNGRIVLSANHDVSVGGELHGGQVEIVSESGDVRHRVNSKVETYGSNMIGRAGNDYILDNGTVINAGNGVVDIYAEENLYMGSSEDQYKSTYDWDYVSDTRAYEFREFGYYVVDDNNNLVYVPLVVGEDIGKDGLAPIAGSGVVYEDLSGLGLYTVFHRGGSGYIHPSDTSNTDSWTFHQDAEFNADGIEHVQIDGIRYGWEDIFGGGDLDFDDAVIDFAFDVVKASPGAFINSDSNVFLTAQNGFIKQVAGDVCAKNLMFSANHGITGTGINGGFEATAQKVSAENRGSGDIRIDNKIDTMITDLSNEVGLNPGVVGTDGINNQVVGGTVDVVSRKDLTIKTQVKAKGDIILKAYENMFQKENGKVVIDQDPNEGLLPVNVYSTSHQTEQWSNDNTVDMEWTLPEYTTDKFDITLEAGEQYIMEPGASVESNGGDVNVTANDDILLTLIDAHNGDVAIISQNGSIIDNDLDVAPADYDVIGHHIQLQADNGSVGENGNEQEIDLGAPHFEFSYVADTLNNTIPDNITDTYTVSLNEQGDWIYQTTFLADVDNANWGFHLLTMDESNNALFAAQHVRPFFIDTTAPIITGDYLAANEFGWHNQDVTVSFSATDNLSGFNPDGSLTAGLNSETITQEGIGLVVTSDGIFDRAGNAAQIIDVVLNIDQTAPVITDFNLPDPNEFGWYNQDVTVDFSATDNLSGFNPDGALSTNLLSQTSTGEGVGLIITSEGITDRAGNVANRVEVAVNVDKTAPVISADYLAANEFGWHNQDVTVDFSATDNLSGFNPDGALSAALNSETITAEGLGLIVTSDGIFDRAGNAAVPLDVTLNIDKTAPVISADYLAANEFGWHNQDVTVDFSATDNLSGFNPDGALSTALNSETITAEGLGLIVTSDGVFDRAGNAAELIDVVLNIDKTAPVVSADYLAPNEFGWHNQDVTVDFSATDNLSGFNPDGALSTNLNSETITSEAAGIIVTSDGIFDRAGNAAVPVDVVVNLDKTAPVITAGDPTGPTNSNGEFTGDVTVPFSATDNLSGFAPDGNTITDLSSETGQPGFIVTSDGIFDLAGNFAPGIPVGPFAGPTVTPPTTPPTVVGVPLTFEYLPKEYTVYYEVLSPSQFLSFEPTLKVGFFGYHPITETNMVALEEEGLDLSIEVYEFIEDQMDRKKRAVPYFANW